MRLKIKNSKKNDKIIYKGRIIDFSIIDEKDYPYYYKLFPNSFIFIRDNELILEKKEKTKKKKETDDMIVEEIFFPLDGEETKNIE